MYIIIERFEGDVAVCYDSQGRVFNIHLGELPVEAREGDAVEYGEDGYIMAGSGAAEHDARVADKRLRRFYDEN